MNMEAKSISSLLRQPFFFERLRVFSVGVQLSDSILLNESENLLLLPGTLVQDLFLNSSVKVVDLVKLWVDRLDVVDELKVLASIGGVHDVLF